MLAASQRKFDVLLFWKLDRLTREGARRALQYLTQLDGWNVAWRSYTEPFFDSCGPFKDVVVSIMSTLDNLERVKISERTKVGLAGATARESVSAPAIPQSEPNDSLAQIEVQRLSRATVTYGNRIARRISRFWRYGLPNAPNLDSP